MISSVVFVTTRWETINLNMFIYTLIQVYVVKLIKLHLHQRTISLNEIRSVKRSDVTR